MFLRGFDDELGKLAKPVHVREPGGPSPVGQGKPVRPPWPKYPHGKNPKDKPHTAQSYGGSPGYHTDSDAGDHRFYPPGHKYKGRPGTTGPNAGPAKGSYAWEVGLGGNVKHYTSKGVVTNRSPGRYGNKNYMWALGKKQENRLLASTYKKPQGPSIASIGKPSTRSIAAKAPTRDRPMASVPIRKGVPPRMPGAPR